jgi:hypothetical protein
LGIKKSEMVFASETIDLWEAWIDVQEAHTLYVIGEVCVGNSKTTPIMLRKQVQGTTASHLVLELLPCICTGIGNVKEVTYTETIADISQYEQISICNGDALVARISTIEVVA